jgi:hypothetical protein
MIINRISNEIEEFTLEQANDALIHLEKEKVWDKSVLITGDGGSI